MEKSSWKIVGDRSVDIVYVHDPWESAVLPCSYDGSRVCDDPWASYIPPVPPPPLFRLPDTGEIENLRGELNNAQLLIDEQNRTISELCGMLERISLSNFETYSVGVSLSAIFNTVADVSIRLMGLEGYIHDSVDEMKAGRTKAKSVSASPQKQKGKCPPIGSRLHAEENKYVERAEDIALLQELEDTRKIIAELRHRAAAHEASEARRSELQSKGRLLKSLTIPSGATETQFPSHEVFLEHSGCSTELNISEPYLVSSWQLRNLENLLQSLITSTHVRDVKISTHLRSQSQEDSLNALRTRFAKLGLTISFAFLADLHIREVSFNNGITIVADRGLDLYKAPDSHGCRACRNGQIFYFESDPMEIIRKHNVAATVASDAKALLENELAKDLAAIGTIAADPAASTSENETAKKIRAELESSRIEQEIRGLGYISEYEFKGRGCSMEDVVEDIRILKQGKNLSEIFAGLSKDISSYVSLGVLSKKRREDSFMMF